MSDDVNIFQWALCLDSEFKIATRGTPAYTVGFFHTSTDEEGVLSVTTKLDGRGDYLSIRDDHVTSVQQPFDNLRKALEFRKAVLKKCLDNEPDIARFIKTSLEGFSFEVEGEFTFEVSPPNPLLPKVSFVLTISNGAAYIEVLKPIMAGGSWNNILNGLLLEEGKGVFDIITPTPESIAASYEGVTTFYNASMNGFKL